MTNSEIEFVPICRCATGRSAMGNFFIGVNTQCVYREVHYGDNPVRKPTQLDTLSSEIEKERKELEVIRLRLREAFREGPSVDNHDRKPRPRFACTESKDMNTNPSQVERLLSNCFTASELEFLNSQSAFTSAIRNAATFDEAFEAVELGLRIAFERTCSTPLMQSPHLGL